MISATRSASRPAITRRAIASAWSVGSVASRASARSVPNDSNAPSSAAGSPSGRARLDVGHELFGSSPGAAVGVDGDRARDRVEPRPEVVLVAVEPAPAATHAQPHLRGEIVDVASGVARAQEPQERRMVGTPERGRRCFLAALHRSERFSEQPIAHAATRPVLDRKLYVVRRPRRTGAGSSGATGRRTPRWRPG